MFNHVKLKELRNFRVMTQAELAELAQVGQSAICQFESGEIKPSLNTLSKLAKALGVSVADLLDESKEEEEVE